MNESQAKQVSEIKALLEAMPLTDLHGGGDNTIRMDGRCGLTLHEGCAVLRFVDHEGREPTAYLSFFAAAPRAIRYLLAQLEATNKEARLAADTIQLRERQIGDYQQHIINYRTQLAAAEKQLEEEKATVRLYVDLKRGQETKANELYESCERLQKQLGESERRHVQCFDANLAEVNGYMETVARLESQLAAKKAENESLRQQLGESEQRTVRMFPIQRASAIPWELAEIAYATYAHHYSGQSLERLAERGGFGWHEFLHLFYGDGLFKRTDEDVEAQWRSDTQMQLIESLRKKQLGEQCSSPDNSSSQATHESKTSTLAPEGKTLARLKMS